MFDEEFMKRLLSNPAYDNQRFVDDVVPEELPEPEDGESSSSDIDRDWDTSDLTSAWKKF